MSTNTLSVVTSRISLDISRMDIQNNIPVTQGDTKRRLEVTLMNAGQPLAVNENWTVVLVGIKPDGSKISKAACSRASSAGFRFPLLAP